MNRDDHANAVRRHLSRRLWRKSDRERAALLIIESADMYRDACVLNARREAAGDAEAARPRPVLRPGLGGAR